MSLCLERVSVGQIVAAAVAIEIRGEGATDAEAAGIVTERAAHRAGLPAACHRSILERARGVRIDPVRRVGAKQVDIDRVGVLVQEPVLNRPLAMSCAGPQRPPRAPHMRHAGTVSETSCYCFSLLASAAGSWIAPPERHMNGPATRRAG
ncbi:MAG TPA: hypothetical protein VHX61_02430 [Rhizomicrobium sp.]|nr:hypothetical protein [Rhizomicrobium sp.]